MDIDALKALKALKAQMRARDPACVQRRAWAEAIRRIAAAAAEAARQAELADIEAYIAAGAAAIKREPYSQYGCQPYLRATLYALNAAPAYSGFTFPWEDDFSGPCYFPSITNPNWDEFRRNSAYNVAARARRWLADGLIEPVDPITHNLGRLADGGAALRQSAAEASAMAAAMFPGADSDCPITRPEVEAALAAEGLQWEPAPKPTLAQQWELAKDRYPVEAAIVLSYELWAKLN